LFGSLEASTTKNMISPHIDFASVDPSASTTFGTILPDITILSSSTIQQYMPAGTWDLIYFLMRAALWIGFAYKVVQMGWIMLNYEKYGNG